MQSRFYNPEWGRFVNADAIVGRIGDLLTHNMYNYCYNRPITLEDPSGFDAEDIGRTYKQTPDVYGITISAGIGTVAAGVFWVLEAGVYKLGERLLPSSNAGRNFIKLSSSNIKHISKHIPYEFSKQASYMSDKQLINKLYKTSFFNPNWSKQQVINAVEQAYNALRSQGLTGLQSYKIYGEVIKIYIKSDGTLDTAYGLHKLPIHFFRK